MKANMLDRKMLLLISVSWVSLQCFAVCNIKGTGSNEPNNLRTNNQQPVDVDDAVAIQFNPDNTVSISNPYDKQVKVETKGGHVSIYSSMTDTEVNYILSGSVKDGSIKIYSSYKLGLILNGVSIINPKGAAINIQSSKKTSVSLVDNTNNHLTDGTPYLTDNKEDMKGTFFSEGQLVFDGRGSLQIYGQSRHAICSDDYIRINGGNIQISTAVKDGIHTNDYFEMNGGKLTITSDGDGIDCEKGYITIKGGEILIDSKNGDGIKTSYKGSDTDISPDIYVKGAKIDISIQGSASKGITSKGNIELSGGEIKVNSTGDALYDQKDADVSSSAGIKAKGDMIISGDCAITIESTGKGGKGINVDGELVFDGGITTVTTSGDQYVYDRDNNTASKAIKSDGSLTVNAGKIAIKTTKREAEGLESKSTLTINGGTVEIEAFDDAINASKHIEITGGQVYCRSMMNDAIDSNGTITISGGTVIAIGAGGPECGFDCDFHTFKISGGTVIGIASSSSIPSETESTQRSIVYGKSGNYDLIHINSDKGGEVLTFRVPEANYQQSTLLFSSPDLNEQDTYTIYTEGNASGGNEFNGLYTGAKYTKGTSEETFTPSTMVTTIGQVMVRPIGPPPGGFMDGMPDGPPPFGKFGDRPMDPPSVNDFSDMPEFIPDKKE